MLGTATDTLVLWLLSHFILKGYAGEYVISPIISFECANVVNFFICSRWVWGERTKDCSRSTTFKRFIGFNLSYTGTFLLKLGLIQVIGLLSGWDVVWCNLIALMISGIVNFIMNEKVVFSSK
ncbi:MAG: GtrA family protein [Bacteroidia bacterium]|nr:GtrA family protein [Bacteroidia bacterium]